MGGNPESLIFIPDDFSPPQKGFLRISGLKIEVPAVFAVGLRRDGNEFTRVEAVLVRDMDESSQEQSPGVGIPFSTMTVLTGPAIEVLGDQPKLLRSHRQHWIEVERLGRRME